MRDEKTRLVQAIINCLKNNQLRKGIKYCQELTNKYPQKPEGWALSSEIVLKLGNPSKALELVDRAMTIDPRGQTLNILRAECLAGLLRIDEAVQAALEELTSSEQDPKVLQRIGVFFSVKCEDHAQALDIFKKSIELSPDNASYWYNCGAEHRFLGNIEEAEKCWEKAIELTPTDSEIFFSRSHLKKQTANNNHIKQLEQFLLGSHRSQREPMHYHYALAKEYEDLGQFDHSFKHLKKGSSIRRSFLQYDLQADLDTIDAVIDVFDDRQFQDQIIGSQSNRPIFILGLPRTGTTLVERIVGSHSDVSSAGELNEFALSLMQCVGKTGSGQLSRTDLVKATAGLDFKKLGEKYLQLSDFKSGSLPRFIDKMPLNFLYCGLIHKALPNAKIIHVYRHPLDSIFAIYKQLFKSAYPMSYDLDELAKYYVAYDRLMKHWRSVIPTVLFDLAYEDLVQQQEETTRDLLEYCELPWEEACLSFEKNKAASTTASATQIRKPIYSTSIGKWKHFENELSDVIDHLQAAGIQI